MDLLTTEETWKPLRDLDESSEDASSVKVDADTTGKRQRHLLSVFEILEREGILFVLLGLGERILREEKEMREMKRRLLAIEADLQALYRENEEESTEVSLLTLSITHVSSRSNCC